MGGMSLAYGGGFPEFTSDGFKDALGIIAKIAAGNGFYAEQDQYTAPTDPLNSGDVWLTFAHMAPVGTSYNAAPNNYVIGAAPKGSKGAGPHQAHGATASLRVLQIRNWQRNLSITSRIRK